LTFNKWVSAHPDADRASAEDRELARENERLRRKVRILKAESRDDADAERLSDYVWY
jgi:transposase